MLTKMYIFSLLTQGAVGQTAWNFLRTQNESDDEQEPDSGIEDNDGEDTPMELDDDGNLSDQAEEHQIPHHLDEVPPQRLEEHPRATAETPTIRITVVVEENSVAMGGTGRIRYITLDLPLSVTPRRIISYIAGSLQISRHSMSILHDNIALHPDLSIGSQGVRNGAYMDIERA